MDFHLQHVRTGEILKLAPERTLIGGADHADVRTDEDGPYLAALVVRYPTGWGVFGLSDDPAVTYNRRPLQSAQRVTPKKGDVLGVGDERFVFLTPHTSPDLPANPAPPCFVYVQNPDGMEECRAVDHDLLFGRLSFCHVQLADTRLSRLSALLASHDGAWYVHTLSKKPLGRNRKAVHTFARVEDGDELLVGPLVVRVEVRDPTGEALLTPPPSASDSTVTARRRAGLAHAPPSGTTDIADATDDGSGTYDTAPGPDLHALRESAQRLENWLKAQTPAEQPGAKGGLGGWLDAQRDRLRRFWYDTPETTAARSLRTAGKADEAFAILERAVRARPDSPELLRELYRLYESIGFADLCFRPLRHIEKLCDARGTPDAWLLETLARLCERLGRERPSMIDRAVAYWTKLETATGISRSRQRTDALALRALRDGGYADAAGDSIG